jgi:4-amino-4-deoxy-L-arabinose transferase-like glycosyltransferase
MTGAQKDGWIVLSAWLISTFIIFSLNRSKLPAYILPLFPALAVMTALRWPDLFERTADSAIPTITQPPAKVWLSIALLPLFLMAVLPLGYRFGFGIKDSLWGVVQLIIAAILFIGLAIFGRRWPMDRLALSAGCFSLINLLLAAAYLPNIETELKNNQSLKPLGLAVRHEFQAGDQVVCWARLPQGLPFYAFPAISSTNRPYLGRMPEDRMPFLFPGNRAKLEPWLIKDETAFKQMLAGQSRLLVVAFKGTFAQTRQWLPTVPLRLIFAAGDYELFVNRR